jgi:hypothetical protein
MLAVTTFAIDKRFGFVDVRMRMEGNIEGGSRKGLRGPSATSFLSLGTAK